MDLLIAGELVYRESDVRRVVQPWRWCSTSVFTAARYVSDSVVRSGTDPGDAAFAKTDCAASSWTWRPVVFGSVLLKGVGFLYL